MLSEKTTRYHHLSGIQEQYCAPIFNGQLRYSPHARTRFSQRIRPIVQMAPPRALDTQNMSLLAVDVNQDGQVVQQLWRTPLPGVEMDMVIAVNGNGRVATLWTAARNDPDGVKKQWAKKPQTMDPPHLKISDEIPVSEMDLSRMGRPITNTHRRRQLASGRARAGTPDSVFGLR